MPFLTRPFRRFPVHCAVTYHAGPFVKLFLDYLLGFWLLITLLLLSSGPVYAEWVAVEETPGLRTVYVDPDTIRREGNLVTLWLLMDFQWMQGNVGLGRFGLDRSLPSAGCRRWWRDRWLPCDG